MRAKFLAILLLCICIGSLTGCAGQSAGSKAMLGLPQPTTRVQLLGGAYVPLSQYLGKKVVLVFFAQWCSRSKGLLRDLGPYALERRARGDVEFLAVSVDKEADLSKVQAFASQPSMQAIDFAFSGNAEFDEAYLSFQCSEVPQVFIIDPNGTIVAQVASFDAIEKELAR
ncbi:MAG: TlpA family protein disulfide reductase [Oligoflexia bacterium]|nr:TlpA family protein disulfide reductase [Oligoflexia bacterium]